MDIIEPIRNRRSDRHFDGRPVAQQDIDLLIQGYAMGLTIHAMAGYDEQKVLQGFAIPAPFRVAAVVAAGYRGRAEELPEEVRAKDLKPRTRRPVAEIAFRDKFGAVFKT